MNRGLFSQCSDLVQSQQEETGVGCRREVHLVSQTSPQGTRGACLTNSRPEVPNPAWCEGQTQAQLCVGGNEKRLAFWFFLQGHD